MMRLVSILSSPSCKLRGNRADEKTGEQAAGKADLAAISRPVTEPSRSQTVWP